MHKAPSKGYCRQVKDDFQLKGTEYAFVTKESGHSRPLEVERQLIDGLLPDSAPWPNGRYGRGAVVHQSAGMVAARYVRIK